MTLAFCPDAERMREESETPIQSERCRLHEIHAPKFPLFCRYFFALFRKSHQQSASNFVKTQKFPLKSQNQWYQFLQFQRADPKISLFIDCAQSS